jgi:uncharacterized surface protein with fasciclin (FAS1) repeats
MLRTIRTILPVTALAVTLGLALSTVSVAGGPKEGAQPIFPLAKKAGFNTLTAAIQAAGLQGTLTSGGPFTVFAPTDEAFAKLPAGTVESLLANPEALKAILLYHVVEGEVPASTVVTLTEAETLNGAKVTIDTTSGVVLNGNSTVTQTDIKAKNGIIHVIDTVLLPPSN